MHAGDGAFDCADRNSYSAICVSTNAWERPPRSHCVADPTCSPWYWYGHRDGETAVVLSVLAEHLSKQNLGTYWAQTAAGSHFRPLSAGHPIVGRCDQWRTALTVTVQVKARMNTSSPGWATMHRASRRCSS